MDLKKMWIKDPKTGEESVSLTLVIVSATVCFIAAGLEMAGLIKTVSICFEMFGASCGLYWGRRFGNGKVNISEDLKQ